MRNNSEADFGDDEHSVHGDAFRSRASSMATPWKRRTGSVRSHCSQIFTPSHNVNGRLNISLDQNGVTTLGLHTPTSIPAYSTERVREDLVSDGKLMGLASKVDISCNPNKAEKVPAPNFPGVSSLLEADQLGGPKSQASPPAVPVSDPGGPCGSQEKGTELRQLPQRRHGRSVLREKFPCLFPLFEQREFHCSSLQVSQL